MVDIRQLQPKDMSPLASEVGLMMRDRCSVSESEVSPEERVLNETMIGRILNLEQKLKAGRAGQGGDGEVGKEPKHASPIAERLATHCTEFFRNTFKYIYWECG